jgi:hypothetical protein
MAINIDANVICGVTDSKGLLSGDILAPVKAEEVSDEIPTVAPIVDTGKVQRDRHTKSALTSSAGISDSCRDFD